MNVKYKRYFVKFVKIRTLFLSFLILLLYLILVLVFFQINSTENELSEINFQMRKNNVNLSFSKLSEKKNLNRDKLEALFVPNNTVMTKKEMFVAAEKESNLALIYWSEWKNYDKNNFTFQQDLSHCDIELPSPHLLEFSNILWQKMHVNKNLIFFLYNAYYDDREIKKKVKVITVTNMQKLTENLDLWCLLWFENNWQPIKSKVSKIYSLWPHIWGRDNGTYGPQLISCDIPYEVKDLIPRAISLINEDSCEAKFDHNLRVIYNKPVIKQQFGVCVQALRFATHDISVRLIEWLEILKILGANKVYFYKLSAHENVEKVLDFYSQQGFVEYKDLKLPGVQINTKHLFQWYFEQIGGKFWPQELLVLNDCLYKNLYKYEYLAILDVDEIIIPKNSYNWSQLIEEIKSTINNEKKIEAVSFYENTNTYVFGKLETDRQSIAPYLYTMRHLYRNVFSNPGSNIKCFHVLRSVEAVSSHYPSKCLGRDALFKEFGFNCFGHRVNTNQSYLMHFRAQKDFPEKCDKQDLKDCAVYDTVMWKYYEVLDRNMKYALKEVFNS